MYLHLIDDIPQINHFIKRSNDLSPHGHLFLAITSNGELKKIKAADNVRPFIPTKKNISEIAQMLLGYDAVFIHNLCCDKAQIVLLAPGDVVFIWGVWGCDYYYVYPQFFRNFFLPYTKTANFLLLKLSLTYKFSLYYSYPVIKYFGIKSGNRIKREAAKRISYSFNNMNLHSDFFKVVDIPPGHRFKGLYYSVEDVSAQPVLGSPELGNNIFVGNSAANSGNHLDIFIQLKKAGLKGKTVVVPLSYGCWRYKKFINLMGRLILKGMFQPLNNYLPLEKYNGILMGCNVMIYNHCRSQAFGNIIFGIWTGHKVFLRKQNPIYAYLKYLGIVVLSVDDDLTINNLTRLPTEVQKENRRIIESFYSETQIRNNYIELLSAIRKADC